MLKYLKGLFSKEGLIGRVLSDIFTSMSGDYDPARLIGYGFVILGGTEFLILEAYVTIKNSAFDATNFSIGLAGISAAMVAAAAGVYIKKTTEVPVGPPKAVTNPIAADQARQDAAADGLGDPTILTPGQ